ncbi:efflux RND transporter periplasmic adaptor subunit [Desulfobacula phenolica]|uniref:Multidrug resistance efflux pump n=1 Tax=Desulfobacula phenolica TaxID=90732 RepID=A0A1H2DNS4_9BACT|nr:efflux RND transporter periplasmic adaptor subunit [Desulfobacula phenolica]SDT84446.1 Multidrug resistance efflux pump [Desulfobacula phenolica]
MNKLFRNDVTISPDKNGGLLVQHPSISEKFSFTPEEAFLIKELKKPYNIRVLLIKYNAKFKENKTTNFISEFVARLDSLGLLQDNESSPSPDMGEKKETEDSREEYTHSKINSTRLNHWSFFSPQKIIDSVVRIFGFFRFFHGISVLIFCIALYCLFYNLHLFKSDLAKVSSILPLFKQLMFTLFTVNLFSQVFKGCIARYYGIQTPSFGIILAYGIIPRFDVWIDIPEQTSQRIKLWLTASAILSRIILFNIGIMVWILTRSTGTNLSVFGAALALFSIFSLLFIVNPFFNGDGYRFITLYYNMTNIREKAIRSIKNRLFSTPEVIARHTEDRLALKIYGLFSLLFIVSVVAFIGFSLGHWLEEHYRGLGMVLLFLITVYLIVRFRYLSQARKKRTAGIFPEKNTPGTTYAYRQKPPKKNRSILMRLVLIAAFIWCLILPYQYKAGGTAVITPVHHQKIYSENKGIVKKVYFNGGEWLEKGTMIAEMENYRYQNDVDVTRQAIGKIQEEINILLTTPSKEEVELARQELMTSKMTLTHSEDDYKRLKALYKANAVSYVDYLTTQKKKELNQQQVLEKEANLRWVEHQVNSHKIESMKKELAMLESELKFVETKLEKTRLRMPNKGKLITMNLKNSENKFLDDGQFFAEIEDSSRVQIEIQVPELEASYVSIGDPMVFKAQLYPDRIIHGKITSIHPVMTSTDVGNMLKVVSVVPNDNFVLKTGMTGYAKIEGKSMLVIQAFTRSLINFFLIEFWSWLP